METKVVLDTNIYCETNYGRSGKFSSLLDFLKRSGSQLLVLPSVLEEVLAKHDRDFKELVDAANSSVKRIRQHAFAERLVLLRDTVDFSKERDAVRRSILDLGKGVTADFIEGITIDAIEVVRRGANRIPPANSNGEELRDVIHWLTVLSYAKQHTDTKILFVSRDNGFWLKQGGPREEILQDVRSTGQDIQLFKDIEDLLRQNSLSSADLDLQRAAQLFDLPQLESVIVSKIGEQLNGSVLGDRVVEFRSGRLISFEFQKGTIYQVSASSEFIEATFRLQTENEIAFKTKSPWGSMAPIGNIALLSTVFGSVEEPPIRITTFATAELSLRVIDHDVGTPAVERISLEKPA